MKKLLCLLNICLSFTLIGCVEEVEPNEPPLVTTPDNNPKPELEDEDKELEDEELEDEDVELEDEEETDSPANYSPLEMIEFLNTNINNYTDYKKTSVGTSKTLSGVDVTQAIENNTYVYSEYVYAHYASNSWAVSFDHKVLLSDTFVNYTHDKNSYSNVSRQDYSNKYGIVADSINFTGYLIDEDTILSSSIETYDSYYSFIYTLDNDLSSESMKVQMMEFGELKSLPVFDSIKITINIDKNFNILSINTNEIYNTVKRVLFWDEKTKLEQNLTTTFTRFDDLDSLPNIDDYL